MANEKYLGKQNLREITSAKIGKSGETTGYWELYGGDSVAVSPAGTARIRYNTTTKIIEKSVNGGAWVPLGGDWRPVLFTFDDSEISTIDDKGGVAVMPDGSIVTTNP